MKRSILIYLVLFMMSILVIGCSPMESANQSSSSMFESAVDQGLFEDDLELSLNGQPLIEGEEAIELFAAPPRGFCNTYVSASGRIFCVFRGGSQSDTINGTNYDDVVYGNDGMDYLYSHGGHDYIYGGRGFDFLFGGSGSDRLNAGPGGGEMHGGLGNDVFAVSVYYGGYHIIDDGTDAGVVYCYPKGLDKSKTVVRTGYRHLGTYWPYIAMTIYNSDRSRSSIIYIFGSRDRRVNDLVNRFNFSTCIL